MLLELLEKLPEERMTAVQAESHRWVRKDFDAHDGPRYKVQTLRLRR